MCRLDLRPTPGVAFAQRRPDVEAVRLGRQFELRSSRPCVIALGRQGRWKKMA